MLAFLFVGTASFLSDRDHHVYDCHEQIHYAVELMLYELLFSFFRMMRILDQY